VFERRIGGVAERQPRPNPEVHGCGGASRSLLHGSASVIVRRANLFADVPARLTEEQVKPLVDRPGARVERIVSTGQASPAGFWCDQDWAEWVIVLAGAANLLIEGEERPRILRPGDYVELPAHVRHRVEWTDPDRPTVWLAIHWGGLSPG
jgi:cupin 2 domain-containing protein